MTWALLVLCDRLFSTIKLRLIVGVRENSQTTLVVHWSNMNSVPDQQVQDSLGEQFNIIALCYI